jgi:hypothetical protein
MFEIQSFIESGLKLIRQNTNAFDLNSLLLKPIQRVLKYPLLLQELIKNTDETHEDYQDLVRALKCMQDVASYINEIKRRHELSQSRHVTSHTIAQPLLAMMRLIFISLLYFII